MKRFPVWLSGLAVWCLLAGLLYLLANDGPGVDRPPAIQGGADSAGDPPDAATAAATPSGAIDRSLLLPDLTVAAPEELFVRFDSRSNLREIRFSTTVTNRGLGPLELVGTQDPVADTVTATQKIQRFDGGVTEHDVGLLAFHPEHLHWHLEDFAVFELWTYHEGGELETLVASTGKITFCLLDYYKASPAPANVASEPEFIDCSWRIQGISEGWSETYTSDLPGQELDVTAVPDGRYAIRTVLDPDNRLRELNEGNNSIVGYVELRGGRIEVLEEP